MYNVHTTNDYDIQLTLSRVSDFSGFKFFRSFEILLT